jgi:hypothetical protein
MILDVNFERMVTTKLIKLIYRVALVVITLTTLLMIWYGLDFLTWNISLGLMTLLAAALGWLINVLLVRVFLEFLINQFKITEHLRSIKNGDGML